MKFSSVLIITYGRSGSTLLQGLLNSIKGCLVRGENYNFCYGLFEAYESLLKAQQEDYRNGQLSKRIESPWYGAYQFDENRFLADARKLVLHQLNPDDEALSCVGFKEIRYMDIINSNPKKLQAYLSFLGKLFPNPAFIVLTRDHEQVVNSGWWQSKDREKVKSQLAVFEEVMHSFNKNKDNFFFLDYNDIIQNNKNLVGMFQFLGATYKDDNVKKILLTKHSYQPRNIKYFRIKQTDYTFIEYANIDKVPLKKSMVSGVIVLSNDVDFSTFSLFINNEKIKWGVSSPFIADKFPKNSNAKNARFVIDNVDFSKYSEIDIFLRDNAGKEYILFKLTRSKN